MSWLLKLKPITKRISQVDPYMLTLKSIAVVEVAGYVYFGVTYFRNDTTRTYRTGTYRRRQT